MSKTVQFKRGNANVSTSYVGAQGEITINTDNYTLNVHDGLTPGGYSILNTNVSNIGNLVVTNQTITGTAPNTNITLSPTNASVVLTSNLVTPNIDIRNYTISSTTTGSSLTLPSSTDSSDVELRNNTSNIKFSTVDQTTSIVYTMTLDRNSYLTLPGYIKSTLGEAEIQFGGTQGLLLYADFSTGSTGISLNDVGQTQMFANSNISIITDYDDTTRSWTFDTSGNLTFPDGSVQSTAYIVEENPYGNSNVVSLLSNFGSNVINTSGNITSGNLLISYLEANTQSVIQTLSNADMRLTATDGIYSSSIYLWANNQRMSFNTVSNAFDFNFNGQLSATDFTASKNSAYGYSFYAEGGGYSGMRHISGPPDLITINHEGNVFAGFYGNYTTHIYGNLVVSSDGETFGSFPDAYAQVYSNVDSYSQFVLQNVSDGTSASTDLVLTADNGNDSSYYINLGIDGSNYSDPSWFGDSNSSNDGYLVVVGNDATGPSTGNVGNLILGSTNGIVKTFVGNIAEANVITVVNSEGLTVTGDITANNVEIIGNLAVGTGGNLNVMTVKTEGGVISIGNQMDGTFVVTDPNFDPSIYVAGQQFYITTNGNAAFQQFTFGVNGSANVAFPGNLSLGDGTDSEIINSGNNVVITANTASWIFNTDGTLTAPGNVSGTNFIVSESIITTGASPAPVISGFSSVSAINLIASGNISGNVNGYSIGYRDIPQVIFTSNSTLSLTDAGKHYYSANSANVITIPNNATVNFNIGTAVSIVQEGTANLTITPDSGVTLYLAGNSTAGSRTLGNYGMATLMKVATDTWFINGTGVN
jgi:hypothetical protein